MSRNDQQYTMILDKCANNFEILRRRSTLAWQLLLKPEIAGFDYVARRGTSSCTAVTFSSGRSVLLTSSRKAEAMLEVPRRLRLARVGERAW